jgi:hypothetical protein
MQWNMLQKHSWLLNKDSGRLSGRDVTVPIEGGIPFELASRAMYRLEDIIDQLRHANGNSALIGVSIEGCVETISLNAVVTARVMEVGVTLCGFHLVQVFDITVF